MDWNTLKRHIGEKTNDKDASIKSAYNNAVIMIDTAIADPFRPVPESVREMMIMEVGATIYRRKNAPGNGQAQQYDGDVTPVRTPRDPLFEVLPILRRYVVAF